MDAESREHHVYPTKLDGSGRIVLPAEVRSELGVSVGDVVVIVKNETGLHVETPRQALRALQDYFQQLVPGKISLADELIAERRAEAERE